MGRMGWELPAGPSPADAPDWLFLDETSLPFHESLGFSPGGSYPVASLDGGWGISGQSERRGSTLYWRGGQSTYGNPLGGETKVAGILEVRLVAPAILEVRRVVGFEVPAGYYRAAEASRSPVQSGHAPELVVVQGGTFRMGDTLGTGFPDERPAHDVKISSFYIGKYEVTPKEWREAMGTSPASGSSMGDPYPVYNVSWYEAVECCNQLSVKEGLTPCYSGSGTAIRCNFSANGYRLPTEAEWEFATRGGTLSREYKFAGSSDATAVAWYSGNSTGQPHPVGNKAVNELGLYDMSGNVGEWCWDFHGAYSSGPQKDPAGGTPGSGRIERGGGSIQGVEYHRVTARAAYGPERRYNAFGFRVVRRP
jgi:formylglycine-generating enzyme